LRRKCIAAQYQHKPQAGAGGIGKTMLQILATLKKWAATPAVKYPLIAIASALWLFGLADQLPDPVQTAKYVGLSALIAAVATV
jgi:hypothetical protein